MVAVLSVSMLRENLGKRLENGDWRTFSKSLSYCVGLLRIYEL